MINIHCFCFGTLGVQQHGRYFVSLLRQFEDIALFPWDDIREKNQLPDFVQCMLENAKGNVENNLGIGIGVMNRMGLIKGRYKIASTIWETTRIPENELAHLSDIDQLWTPSCWGRNVLVNNGLNADRVKVVPEGVDIQRFKPGTGGRGEANSKPFRFLCVGKWEERKGINLLLEAFCHAFRPGEAVELVLHCYNSAVPGFSMEQAINKLALAPHAPISISYPVPDKDMAGIYTSCDAFVLASRGEGWGLPIIEAMACELPVIVTNYSAYLDFVTSENAYLLNVERMVDVDDPLHFDSGQDFGLWAEPDREHLVHLLREVFENQEEAAVKGRRARQDVAKKWTWHHAVKKAWNTLQSSQNLAQG